MREPSEYTTSIDMGQALGCDRDISVWYYFTPEQRGRYSGPPEDCYPDEPAEVEITKIEWVVGNNRYELPVEMFADESLSDIIQNIIEKECDERAEAYVEAMERRRGCDYTDDWP